MKRKEMVNMKRLIALLLAAVLALSLAACGNGDSNRGSSESPEETTMTEEEMLAEAVSIEDIDEVKAIMEETPDYLFSSDAKLGIYALHKLYEQNPLVFAENYFDQPYCITGYVDEISSEGFDLEIEPDAGENLEFQISVIAANQDELLEIKQGDLITIVGFLGEIDGENFSYINVPSAYII